MEAHNRSLPEWFGRIRTGQLRLPRFQRHEVWAHAETAALLESVLRGLPVGAALILQVGDREIFLSRPMAGAPEPTERVTEHLLDGQQRLTVLWRAAHDNFSDRKYFVYFDSEEDSEQPKQPFVYGQARWTRDGAVFPLWADDPAQTHRRGYLPLALLRPGDDVIAEIRKWCDQATGGDLRASRELDWQIVRLRERMTTFNLPYLSLPVGTPRDVALDVFIKLNNSSVRLTAFDIVVAEVEAATGQSLHQLVQDLIARVPALSHYIEPEDLILNAAAMREDRPPTQKSFQLLDYGRLVDGWEDLVGGAQWLVECLEAERVFDAARLPTVAVLPVVAALYQHVAPALDERGNAKILMRRYLWRAFLTRRYENAAATRALQDFRGLRSALQNVAEPTAAPIFEEAVYPAPSAEETLRAGWPKTRDILARGMLALSIKSGAADLADGRQADRGHLASREYHHLFPEHLLTSFGQVGEAESSRALNCVLITWNTNRDISAKEPLVYLRERTQRGALGEEEVRARLRSHLVPYEALAVGGCDALPAGHLRSFRIAQDYKGFLLARAELLQGPIRELFRGADWPRLS